MQSSDIPDRFNIPFANAATGSYIRPIPTASQIGVDNGRASLADGFPPDTFTPISGGGVPPSGRDMNGILFRSTAWSRWLAAGAPISYSAAFSAAIGGYPAGAFLQSSTLIGVFYVSTVENNTTNPEAGGANWQLAIPTKASAAEVTAGTDDAKFVTPRRLAGLRATSADILAGTSDALYVTPAALAATYSSVAGSPGLMVHPNGFIEQWGRTAVFQSGEGASSLPFPVPFPNAVFNVVMGAINSSNSNQRDTVPQWNPTGSLTTLSYYRQSEGGGGDNIEGVTWRAIGN